MNINPFYVPGANVANLQDDAAEADEDDGQFGHLERNRLLSQKKTGLGKIVEENQEGSDIESAEAPSEGEEGFRNVMPAASRKSTISGMSQNTLQRRDDDYGGEDMDEAQDLPWVDNFRPRLAPDWTEIYQD